MPAAGSQFCCRVEAGAVGAVEKASGRFEAAEMLVPGEKVMEAVGHRKAAFGELDGRLKQAHPRKPAVTPVRLAEHADQPRHPHGPPPTTAS